MPGIPEDLAKSIEHRYRLEREIGRGGMATVYLARDLKHDREVAVKVLRPDLAHTIGTQRFLREIQIAARLNHPHILPLLDSEEVDGHLLYVMPFVDGDSLRAMLKRRRRLSFDDAVTVAGQVANGLSYAHRHGVIHRDIKPENILFSEGHAIVSDFGIAKALSSLGARELTHTGFPIGTPGYMSPEQAAGRMDLDARSDVYSLACVCYEMLVGDVPAFWLTDRALSATRLLDAPQSHRAHLDELPPQVEPTLVAALAVHPSERIPTPDEFITLLTRRPAVRSSYSNTEAKEILHRAAVIEGNRSSDTGALTTGGIQEIGAEVGLAIEDVEAAIGMKKSAGSDLDDDKLPRALLGAPTGIALERVVDGEVPETEHPRMVEEIRAALGNVGHVSTLKGSLAWTYARSGLDDGRDLHITVMSRNNRTRIRIDERLGNVAGGLYGGLVGGMGGGGGIPIMAVIIKTTGVAVAGIGVGVAVAATAYGLARLFYTGVHRRRHRVLVRLINDLAEIAEATAQEIAQEVPIQRRVLPN